MSKDEFEELLKLTGWTKRKLAKKLKMGENIVYRWYSDRVPRGPAEVCMKSWLRMARKRAESKASA